MNNSENYTPYNKQEIDRVREQQDLISSDLKVASLGIIKEVQNDGYVIQLVPKVSGRTTQVKTVNLIYEEKLKVHSKYTEVTNPSDQYASMKTKIEAVGKEGDWVVVLFLDYMTSKVGNEHLNVDQTKTTHSYSNAFALQLIKSWVGKE